MTLNPILTTIWNALTPTHTKKSPSPTHTLTLTPRDTIPLSLLAHADGDIRSHQRLQKLVFLLDESITETSIYKFIKYDYGPYTKGLDTDLNTLEKHDLIQINTRYTFGGYPRHTYHLTKNGQTALNELLTQHEALQTIHETTDEIITRHGDTPISNLIQHVRDTHPEYWHNSFYQP